MWAASPTSATSSRDAARLGLALLLAATASCSDDSDPSSSGTSSSGAGSSGPDSTSASAQPALLVPEGFRLCSVPFSGQSLDDPFFQNRAMLSLDPGNYVLPESAGPHPADIGMTLQIDADGTLADIALLEGEIEVILDSVPSLLSLNVDPAPGYSTVHYRATFVGAGVESELNLWVARDDSTQVHYDAGPLVEADLSRTRKVHIEGLGHGIYAPCDATGAPIDRVDVAFASGFARFDTRPAWWGGRDGFTVRGEGTVDGVSFDISSYWNLEYSTRSFEQNYGYLPTLGVRFDVGSTGIRVELASSKA